MKVVLNYKKFLTAISVAAACFALVSCANPYGWRDGVREKMDENLNDARGAKPPADVSKALLPPLEIALPEGKVASVEPRFDLTVSNAPARQVFMGLVEGSKYSVVVHPDVQGTLSLNLKEVTVPDAFLAIRNGYGYDYRRDGNRFTVLGREMQTRMFNINYLNLIRKGKSDTRAAGSGEIGSKSSTSGGAGAPSATGAASASGSGTTVETTSQSDFWKDLGEALKAIVGDAGGRKVVVNPQTGVALVRAMPDELRMVEDYLGLTHASVNRQVVLEAKIIEVELNDRFQTGINWAAVKGNYTAGQVGGGSPSLSTSGATPVSGTLGSLRPGTGTFSQGVGTLSNAFGGVFTLSAIGSDFTAFLELLQAQGEVQVLSSPRVSTVNNQKAVIKVGGDEFFVTGATAGTAAVPGVSAAVPASVTLTSFFSGIVLDVTPQIDEQNNIILHIHPSVSTVAEKIKSIIVGSDTFSLPSAFSTIEESDNMVRAQSGQFIVIGGLMKEGTTEENDAIPLLGDIPILGNLFKHKKITRIKKELVILLKPTVVQFGQDWNEPIAESQGRMKKIRIGQ